MSKTPLRSIRVDEDLWNQAQAAAKDRGDNLSAIIREALRAYINESDTK